MHMQRRSLYSLIEAYHDDERLGPVFEAPDTCHCESCTADVLHMDLALRDTCFNNTAPSTKQADTRLNPGQQVRTNKTEACKHHRCVQQLYEVS